MRRCCVRRSGNEHQLVRATQKAAVLAILADSCIIMAAKAVAEAWAETLRFMEGGELPVCGEEETALSSTTVIGLLVYALAMLISATAMHLRKGASARFKQYFGIVSELTKWAIKAVVTACYEALAAGLYGASNDSSESGSGDEDDGNAGMAAYAIVAAAVFSACTFCFVVLLPCLQHMATAVALDMEGAESNRAVETLLKLTFALPLGYSVHGIFTDAFKLIHSEVIGYLLPTVWMFALTYGGGFVFSDTRLSSCHVRLLPLLGLLKTAWALQAGWALASVIQRRSGLSGIHGEALLIAFVNAIATTGYASLILVRLSAKCVVHRMAILFCFKHRVSKADAESVSFFMRTAAGLAIGWAWEEFAGLAVCYGAAAATSGRGSGKLALEWVYTVVAGVLLTRWSIRLDASAQKRSKLVEEQLAQIWLSVDEGRGSGEVVGGEAVGVGDGELDETHGDGGSAEGNGGAEGGGAEASSTDADGAIAGAGGHGG